ncbi:52 kDa repressor of the inhibitor of the protein kinase [Diabrotica virgifera virgifera]|uniref:THAP-type domain-containing protein n=1 Tax=Diabrotica virgifera virgifera TaxID=50390 RepID=A0ABM5L7F3_DIAVI|nr:52 kDa repressor of the inhibitor of the protein kinase [Diabrotica virgifera virgifera]
MLSSERVGHYCAIIMRSCAAINCRNSVSNCSYGFFRFPKDESRAERWVLAAGREDLLQSIGTLHITHRLCGAHFEKKMFIVNDTRKTLLFQAVPTLFPCLEGSTSSVLTDHSYCSFLDATNASR